MGLFNVFKKAKEQNDLDNRYEEIQQEQKRLDEKFEYQNQLLSRVNRAKAQYKKDGDLDRVIREFEFAFVESDPPCESSQAYDLVNYYIKAGMNDKAWGYLNRLYLDNVKRNNQPANSYVRTDQARILKKEKKWEDAIEMYMLAHLDGCSNPHISFNKDKFLKDISSSANKLGWDDKTRNKLATMVNIHVKEKNFNESDLIDEYRVFYENISQNN